LALACEVSRRTIFRDLEILRQVGVPLLYDEVQQRYRIVGTYFLPPTNFTQEEALALIVLCDDLGSRAQLPFFEPARSAALKLASSLPDRLRESLRSASEAISIHLPPTNRMDGQRPVYEQLLSAISERRCVRIAYASFSEESEICTRLQPAVQSAELVRDWPVVAPSRHADVQRRPGPPPGTLGRALSDPPRV
jgi:proteasome accessory factor B